MSHGSAGAGIARAVRRYRRWPSSNRWRHRCGIDVCSAVLVPDDTGWHQVTGANRESRYGTTKSGTQRCRKTLTDIT
jgi:hypothetical protein